MDFNADAWAHLRATRANPPAPARGCDQRRVTYQFGLEQAEQLFRQAAAASPATRPLPLFYGLSQAGRAIAAATSTATDGEWKLTGHGIHAKNLSGPLPDVQISTGPADKAGSFARLSQFLGSPVWGTTTVRLELLWDCLPEAEAWPLCHSITQQRRIPLQADYQIPAIEQPIVRAVVRPLPHRVISSPNPQPLSEYLGGFPDVVGYGFDRRGLGVDADPAYQPLGDGTGELTLTWTADLGEHYTARVELLNTKTRAYLGGRYFFPGLGTPGAERGLHPLMAWWAVLYALSMLTRYQPVEWARHIDVNTSESAVPIEELLRTALDILPELIRETIDEVVNDG